MAPLERLSLLGMGRGRSCFGPKGILLMQIANFSWVWELNERKRLLGAAAAGAAGPGGAARPLWDPGFCGSSGENATKQNLLPPTPCPHQPPEIPMYECIPPCHKLV